MKAKVIDCIVQYIRNNKHDAGNMKKKIIYTKVSKDIYKIIKR